MTVIINKEIAWSFAETGEHEREISSYIRFPMKLTVDSLAGSRPDLQQPSLFLGPPRKVIFNAGFGKCAEISERFA